MGGGNTNTSTSTSTSANPQVTSTLNSLLGGVQNAYNAGPTYQAPGANTTGSWNASLAAAGNPDYASAVNSGLSTSNQILQNWGLTGNQVGTMGQTENLANQLQALGNNATAPSLTEQTLMGVAQGNDLGQNDPGYAALRSKLSSDILGDVGSSFASAGRFGGGSYVDSAENNLASSLGSLDYQQYQDSLARQQNALSAIEGTRQQGVANQSSDLTNAANLYGNAFSQGQQGVSNISGLSNNLSSLYSALQAPAATQGLVGSAQDQASQAGADKNLTLLSQLSSILNGTASAGGTSTTSTTPSTPLWQSLLGLGIAAL